MLKILCLEQEMAPVKNYLVTEIAKHIKSTTLQTLACDYYDKDTEAKLEYIIRDIDGGFVFDEFNGLGKESYGYVNDFFYSYRRVCQELKEHFPTIKLDGEIHMNYYGPYDCVLRVRVEGDAGEEKVSFIDQRQCLECHEWVDVEKAWELVFEDEVCDLGEIESCDDWYDEILLPSNYSVNGKIMEEFCLCSEDCKVKWKRRFKEVQQ